MTEKSSSSTSSIFFLSDSCCFNCLFFVSLRAFSLFFFCGDGREEFRCFSREMVGIRGTHTKKNSFPYLSLLTFLLRDVFFSLKSVISFKIWG